MLDILLSLVKSQSQKAIVENNDVPNEKNELAIAETAQGLMSSLSKMLQSGNLNSLMALAGNLGGAQAQGSPIEASISEVTKRLSDRCGVSQDAANKIAAAVIPAVISGFMKRLSDPEDTQVTPQSLLSMISGGSKESPLLSMLEKFSGQNAIGTGELMGALGGLFGGNEKQKTTEV